MRASMGLWGSLRTEVHGSAGRGQAGKFRPDDRWGMRIGPSRRAGEEQEVHPELRRCVHTFYSSLQEARGVCCVLGSGKLSAPEWSQSRNTVDISQAAEVQSGVKLPRITSRGSHVPLCVLAKIVERHQTGLAIFCCHFDHGQPPACEWSEVARPRAARQERLCRTMSSF